MYKIGSADQHSNVKVHFASTEKIAKEIMNDLKERFGKMQIDTADDHEYLWDPGGMLQMNDEIFRFELSDITFMCYAQHFNYFVNNLQQYTPRGTNTKYVKIHGRYFCICISVDDFEQLKNLVCGAEFITKANESEIKSKKTEDELVESGCIVKVIKDEHGNTIPVLPVNSDIPPKHLH